MTLQSLESVAQLAGRPDEIQALRDRVEELEELIGISAQDRAPYCVLRLPPPQAALVAMLQRHAVVRRAGAYTALYGARLECEQPCAAILEVNMSRLRTVLRSHGIGIETMRGVGWFMTEENKRRLRALVDSKVRA